jgi:hypothetical protein
MALEKKGHTLLDLEAELTRFKDTPAEKRAEVMKQSNALVDLLSSIQTLGIKGLERVAPVLPGAGIGAATGILTGPNDKKLRSGLLGGLIGGGLNYGTNSIFPEKRAEVMKQSNALIDLLKLIPTLGIKGLALGAAGSAGLGAVGGLGMYTGYKGLQDTDDRVNSKLLEKKHYEDAIGDLTRAVEQKGHSGVY